MQIAAEAKINMRRKAFHWNQTRVNAAFVSSSVGTAVADHRRPRLPLCGWVRCLPVTAAHPGSFHARAWLRPTGAPKSKIHFNGVGGLRTYVSLGPKS
jgi:hypothetical protein